MLPDDKRRNHIRSGCTGCPKCQYQKPRRGSEVTAISSYDLSRQQKWEDFRAEVQKELADTAAKKPKPKKTKKKATTVDMDAMWMQPIGEKSKWIYYTDKHGKKRRRPRHHPNPPRKAGLFTGGQHTGGGTYLQAHDQVLAQHPTKGSIEVDVMMKPLLEALWARGIETGYSCSGGNLEPYPFDADEARKKGLNAIPMGEYALEEKWKAHQSQKGDLGVEGDIDNKPGYILFSNVYSGELDIPADFISHRQGGPRAIGWDAAEDYANLRRLYAAFEVDFAHPNPPVEVQPRRVSPTKEGRFVCEGEDVTNQYAVTPVISVDGKTSQLWVREVGGRDRLLPGWGLKPEGNLVRVNMFRRKAGFKVIKNGKPIKTQPDYIISVETGGKHYYASSAVSMEWAKLASFPSKKSEPRLRLETRGILVKSAGKGRVSIRGKMHPLYDKIKVIPSRPKSLENPHHWNDPSAIENIRHEYKVPHIILETRIIGGTDWSELEKWVHTSVQVTEAYAKLKQAAIDHGRTYYMIATRGGLGRYQDEQGLLLETREGWQIISEDRPPVGGEELVPSIGIIRPTKENPPPPATIQWGFQAIPKKPREGHGRLYTGGGKWRQVNLEKALQGELVTAEQSKRYKNTYSPYRSKHFSPLPAEARAWKTSTFKGGESDYEYWVNSLDTDEAPYIATMKIDGEGNMAHFDGEETVLWNWYDKWRTGFAVTDEITQMLKSKKVKSAKLMGELYAVSRAGLMLPLTGGEITEDGSKESTMSFLKKPETLERQERMRLAVFDILELNGKDLRDVPYDERIAIAAGLVGGGKAVRAIPMATGKGLSPLQKIWGEGMLEPEFEGLVLRFKEPSAAQPSKKHRSYKVKGAATADLAVIGFYRGGIKRPGHKGTLAGAMGGLALAFMDEDGNYIYSGNIGTGWSHKERYDIVEELLPHTAKLAGDKVKWGDHHVMTTEYEKILRSPTGVLDLFKAELADEGKKEAAYEALQKEWGVTRDEADARWNLLLEVLADPEAEEELQQLAKTILQTHDGRGRGVMIPVKPTKILEAEYRGLNWNERPVYRLKGKTYEQVGTTRAPALFQPSFKRWRDDKSFTTHDLRLEQVPPEGAGKWDVNPPEEIILFPDFTPPEGMVRSNPNSWGYSPWNSGPYGPGPFGKPPNRPHMQPQPDETDWEENPKSYAGSGKAIETEAHAGRLAHRLGGKTDWWLALVAYATPEHALRDLEDFTTRCKHHLESEHGPVKVHQSQQYLICTKEGVELGTTHTRTGGPRIKKESVQNRSPDEPETLYETDTILRIKEKLNPPAGRAVLISEGGTVTDITYPPQPQGYRHAIEELARKNPPPEGMTIHMYTLKIPFNPEDAMAASDTLEEKGYRFVSEDLTSMVFTLEVPYADKEKISGSIPRISFQQNRANALLFSAHKLTKDQQTRVGRDLKAVLVRKNPDLSNYDKMSMNNLRKEFFRRRKAGEEEYQDQLPAETFNDESKLREFLKKSKPKTPPESAKKKTESPDKTEVRAHKRAKPKSKAKPKRVKSVSTPVSRLIMGSLLIRREWKSKAQIDREKKEQKDKAAAKKKAEQEAKKGKGKKGKKGKGKKGKGDQKYSKADMEAAIGENPPEPQVVFPDWLTAKLRETHTKPGQGSVFAIPIDTLKETIEEIVKKTPNIEEIATGSGIIEAKVEGVGYDLVVEIDQKSGRGGTGQKGDPLWNRWLTHPTLASSPPYVQERTTVTKTEGDKEYKVLGLRTNVDARHFLTDTLSIVVRPMREDDGTTLPNQYIILSAWPGEAAPPVSEWGTRRRPLYAVVLPDWSDDPPRQNPYEDEYIEDHKPMSETKIAKVFESEKMRGPIGSKELFEQMAEKIQTFGEAFGWIRDGKLYWRKGAQTLNEARIDGKMMKNSEAFFHTHPRAWEPSQTSADDFIVYHGLFTNLGICHHFTVMGDRVDWFRFYKSDKIPAGEMAEVAEDFEKEIPKIFDKAEEKYLESSDNQHAHLSARTRHINTELMRCIPEYRAKFKCYSFSPKQIRKASNGKSN